MLSTSDTHFKKLFVSLELFQLPASFIPMHIVTIVVHPDVWINGDVIKGPQTPLFVVVVPTRVPVNISVVVGDVIAVGSNVGFCDLIEDRQGFLSVWTPGGSEEYPIETPLLNVRIVVIKGELCHVSWLVGLWVRLSS